MDADKKLYLINFIDLERFGSIAQLASERDRIGHKLLFLASALKEDIYFHIIQDDGVAGAPSLMIEASKKFIDRMPTEYFVASVQEYTPLLPTVRSDVLKKHYEDAKPPAAPVQKKKPGGPGLN